MSSTTQAIVESLESKLNTSISKVTRLEKANAEPQGELAKVKAIWKAKAEGWEEELTKVKEQGQGM